jgi:hypothetical protein
MNLFRLVTFALALLIAAPAAAQYQVPDHSVPIGRGGSAQGFKNAPPGAASRPLVSNGATSDPSFQQLPNAGLVPGAANTVKGSLNGTSVSDLPLASCSAIYQFTQWISGTGWQCGTNLVLPSRALAATLNLSAFTAVQTQGYATPGDGGGATFVNVGSAAYLDSGLGGFSGSAASCTVAGGSGYTDGTYRNVAISVGGTAGWHSPFVNVTIAGGVVTAVSATAQRGAKVSTGDVLIANGGNSQIGGTGTGFTCTVTAVTLLKGSFTDSGGTHWQFTPNEGVEPNIRQFGAKLDWNGDDATATDDWDAWEAALQYTSINSRSVFVDNGGFSGGRLLVPRGSSLICGPGSHNHSLIIPYGVVVRGGGTYTTTMKMCNAFDAATHFIELCDPTVQVACFTTRLEEINIFSNRLVAANNLVFMIHTNSVQHDGGLRNVDIYSGGRGCTWFEKGYGGAAMVTFEFVECNAAGANTMMKFGNTNASGLNYGTTIFNLRNINMGGPTSGNLQTGPGMTIQGGFYDIVGVHCEGIVTCITIDIAASAVNDQVRMHNVNAANTSGTPCTGTIQLNATNNPGNTIIGMVPPSSCTNNVTNLQGGANILGGTAIFTDIRPNP